jgi:hypothetical protein
LSWGIAGKKRRAKNAEGNQMKNNDLITICIIGIAAIASHAHYCNDTSKTVREQLRWFSSYSYPIISVVGKVIDKKNRHGIDLIKDDWSVSFSLKILVKKILSGHMDCDTIEFIPGQSRHVSRHIDDFEIDKEYLLFIEEQIDIIWKDQGYPECMYLGSSCGFPVSAIVNGKAGNVPIDTITSFLSPTQAKTPGTPIPFRIVRVDTANNRLFVQIRLEYLNSQSTMKQILKQIATFSDKHAMNSRALKISFFSDSAYSNYKTEIGNPERDMAKWSDAYLAEYSLLDSIMITCPTKPLMRKRYRLFTPDGK